MLVRTAVERQLGCRSPLYHKGNYVAIRRFKSRATAGRHFKTGTMVQFTAASDIVSTATRGDGDAGTLNMGLYTLTATLVSDLDAAKADILSTRTLYTVTGTYVAIAQVNARYTGAGYYGAAGAVDGTCYVPAAGDVQFGVNVDATTGTFTSPAVGKVISDTSWGAGGVEFTGTYHPTLVDEVLDSVSFGAGSAETGTYHAPDAAEVISTAAFGPASGTAGTYDVSDVAESNIIAGASIGGVAGTYPLTATTQADDAAILEAEKAYLLATKTITFGASHVDGTLAVANVLTVVAGGTYQAVAAGDVRAGTAVGVSPAVGTFVVPAEVDVRDTVTYGAAGTEFTGSYDPMAAAVFPDPADVSTTDVAYGPTGAEYAGALDLGDYTLTAGIVWPAVANVSTVEAAWGPTGAEYAGELDLGDYTLTAGIVWPAAANVTDDEVAWGPTGAEYAGTFSVPAVADVKDGVLYGAAGTEFEGEYAVSGYTYGSNDAQYVLTTAGAGAGTYHAPELSEVQKGAVVGAAVGTLVGIVDSAGAQHNYGTCSSTQAWAEAGIVHDSGTVNTWGILLATSAYADSGILHDSGTYNAAGIYDGDTFFSNGVFDGSTRYTLAFAIESGGGTYHESTTGEVQSGVTFGPASAYTGTYDPVTGNYTDPGKAWVVVGHNYTFAGVSQTAEYPTTATSQAAQHVTDAAFLETWKSEIAAIDPHILAEFGVTGTYVGTGVVTITIKSDLIGVQ